MERRHFLTCLCLGTAITRADSSDNTLYMLTYDHGGLVLWGMDNFKQYLHSAAEWMDRYARLFDYQGRAAQVAVRYLKGRARLVEVDLAGQEKGAVTSPLSLRPWQFRTVRIEP